MECSKCGGQLKPLTYVEKGIVMTDCLICECCERKEIISIMTLQEFYRIDSIR